MITFEEQSGIFHLRNDKMSYVMQVVRGKYLLHRYWGAPLRKFRDSRAFQALDRAFSPQPGDYENERTFSLDVLPQEYPAWGHLDYRTPAYEVRLADGTTATELRYAGYEIRPGKPRLAGLPAAYAEDDEAETLVITLKDYAGHLTAELYYTIFADLAIVARSARLCNTGKDALTLTGAASFALDFPDHDFDRLSLYGGHAAERSLERIRLMRGIQETGTGSRRGASSHQQSPFLALARPETTEQAGEAFGFSLVWSGEFSFRTEVEQFGTTRVVGGIQPDGFAWLLEPGESFQTPEAWLAYSAEGLDGMSGSLCASICCAAPIALPCAPSWSIIGRQPISTLMMKRWMPWLSLLLTWGLNCWFWMMAGSASARTIIPPWVIGRSIRRSSRAA